MHAIDGARLDDRIRSALIHAVDTAGITRTTRSPRQHLVARHERQRASGESRHHRGEATCAAVRLARLREPSAVAPPASHPAHRIRRRGARAHGGHGGDARPAIAADHSAAPEDRTALTAGDRVPRRHRRTPRAGTAGAADAPPPAELRTHLSIARHLTPATRLLSADARATARPPRARDGNGESRGGARADTPRSQPRAESPRSEGTRDSGGARQRGTAAGAPAQGAPAPAAPPPAGGAVRRRPGRLIVLTCHWPGMSS